jgi:hypothetical protein
VRFTLSPRDLSYYDVVRRDWTATPGTHRFQGTGVMIRSDDGQRAIGQTLEDGNHWGAKDARCPKCVFSLLEQARLASRR